MAVIAVLSLAVWPWPNTQIQELKTRYERRSDIDRIAPGEFQESANGTLGVHRQRHPYESGNNIFIATPQRVTKRP